MVSKVVKKAYRKQAKKDQDNELRKRIDNAIESRASYSARSAAIAEFVNRPERLRIEFLRIFFRYARLHMDYLHSGRTGGWTIDDESLFTDESFPQSLVGTSMDDILSENTFIVWSRPSHFMEGSFSVFDAIEPDDIIQGQLGDCWFLSALSCLAEFPPLIRALFCSDSTMVTTSGRYNLRFCKSGQWQTVVVDDNFPCLTNKYDGVTVLSHPR